MNGLYELGLARSIEHKMAKALADAGQTVVPPGTLGAGDSATQVVDIAEKNVEQQGEHISCRAGCGACCRQIVPISESEAHAVKNLVDDLPEPRRAHVRERFAAGVKRMAEVGMLKRLRNLERERD